MRYLGALISSRIPWGRDRVGELMAWKRLTTNTARIVEDYKMLDSRISRSCSKIAAQMCRVPQGTNSYTYRKLPRGKKGHLDRDPRQFRSSEDFCYFTLISIVYTHLWYHVFRPFHPALSDTENARFLESYADVIENGEP